MRNLLLSVHIQDKVSELKSRRLSFGSYEDVHRDGQIYAYLDVLEQLDRSEREVSDA
jgi:hypothetical protein